MFTRSICTNVQPKQAENKKEKVVAQNREKKRKKDENGEVTADRRIFR
jgi:hypothetical protein